MAKTSRISLVDLKKHGRRNSTAVFNLLTPKDLGISKSYYYKLKRRLADEEQGDLPQTILDRIEKNKSIKNRYSIELKDGVSPKISISKKQLQYHNLKTRKFVWVKFKISTLGAIFYTSFSTSTDNLGKLSQQISSYLTNVLRQYGNMPYYVHEIRLQSI